MSRKDGFWVIVDGSTPTAFRGPERDALVPTLRQLQRTQPACVLRWFHRGRLWESQEQAAEARRLRDERRRERGKEWRPGGTHEDPRARYQLTRDEKRARFKKRQRPQEASAPSAPRPPRTRPPGKAWSRPSHRHSPGRRGPGRGGPR